MRSYTTNHSRASHHKHPNRLQQKVVWCRETKGLGHRIAHTPFFAGHRSLLAIMTPAGVKRVSCGKLTFPRTVKVLPHPIKLHASMQLFARKINIEELLCLFIAQVKTPELHFQSL